MLLNWFGKILQKKLEAKRRKVVRLRWQKTQLEEILRKVQVQKEHE